MCPGGGQRVEGFPVRVRYPRDWREDERVKRPKVEIKPDPMHPTTHRLVMVEWRGRVYGVRWAKPWPTEARVLEVWERDRANRRRKDRTFLPYNQSTDTFLTDWRMR